MKSKIKKIIPYLLILTVLFGVGLFGSAGRANAQSANGTGTCFDSNDKPTNLNQQQCGLNGANSITGAKAFSWIPIGATTPSTPLTAYQQCLAGGGDTSRCNDVSGAPKVNPENSVLENNLKACLSISQGTIEGCLVKLTYILFYQVPAYLLAQSANFFNATVALTLNSALYTKSNSNFIPAAWKVVRDLSNIFFIIILLYIAVKIILDLGGHESKQMIVKVIIIALLINFSMFFTQVIVDSSNILALVFYNKIDVKTTVGGQDAPYIPVTNTPGEKDISGGMVNAFKPDTFMSQTFFDELKERSQVVPPSLAKIGVTGAIIAINVPVGLAVAGYQILGYFFPSKEIPTSTLIAIILLCGLVMCFALYCFLIAGLSFISRLIELWVLIIFSPFAFMSFSIPELSGVEYIGWSDWTKRLLKVSFMAPIFMFFMYFIFLLIRTNIFSNLARTPDQIKQRPIETIVFILIPTLVILILLLQATKFARKASGTVGEAVISGAKTLVGLAIGGAALGTAAVARGGIGAFMKGASTGDTAARRLAAERTSGIRDTNLGTFGRIKGNLQRFSGMDWAQQRIRPRLNADQREIEHAAHARHDLDTAASDTTHGKKKKWDELNGEERYEARRQVARDRVVRDNAAPSTAGTLVDPVTGYATGAFGSRGWDKLSTEERAAVDRSAGVGNDPVSGHAIHGGALENNTTVADQFIRDARRKQGIISSVVQSSVGGSYDIRNLANVVARAQTSGFTKLTAGLIGALAMGMRGGLKQAGVNHGEMQGNFLKDLGNTVTDALKSAKINVDLSKVGEVKKEDGHGHGGGGHH